MTSAALIAALALPQEARVDRRVPKKLLLEQGAPTAADKRQINDGIEALFWVAALKPTTVGVPDYRDAVREYLEIAILALTLRPGAKGSRLIELVHRAVPYPVCLVTEQGPRLNLSLAHKRWSQVETGKTVLDGDVEAVEPTEAEALIRSAFLSVLGLGRQPRNNMFALYQGWMDAALALRAAQWTGSFTAPGCPERRTALREALGKCERLKVEIARLVSSAAKERQMQQRVDLNLKIAQLRTQLIQIQQSI